MIKIIKEKRNEEKINLVHEFNRLNHEVFNNELVLDFPLTWRKLKNSAGKTYLIGNMFNQKVTELSITNFYDMTVDQITNVMIHEMIHVLICQRKIDDRGQTHGHYFVQEMNRINQHFKQYHITPSEDAELLNVDDSHIQNKILKGFIANKKDFFLIQKVYPIDEEYITNVFVKQAKIYKKDQLIEYFETNNSYFFKFKTYRTMPHGRIELFVLNNIENYSNIDIIWSKLIKPDGNITITI